MSLAEERVRCEGFDCAESFPAVHDDLGEPGFEPGRWPGWLFLTVGAFSWRELRFCSVGCLDWWLRTARQRDGEYASSELDRRLREAREGGEVGARRLRQIGGMS